MLGSLLAVLAATTPTAIDAERAFGAEARQQGQWTASRHYAHPDAVMFTPQATWARDFSKEKGSCRALTLVAERQLRVLRRPARGQYRPVAKRG